MDFRQYPLALVRIVIGWHFLYEGLVKLLYPGWTCSGYLKSSTGPLAGFFHWMGSNDALVRVLDQLNIWGLVLIGLALMLGLAARAAAFGGMAMLALYYFAYPPLFGPAIGTASEGHYLLVNKNLIELAALLVVALYPAVSFGLEALLPGRRRAAAAAETALVPAASRRELVAAMAGLPFLGAFVLAVLKKHGWRSFEEIQLRSRKGRHVRCQRHREELPVHQRERPEGPASTRQDRQRHAEPHDPGRQPDRRLGPRPRPDLRLQAGQGLSPPRQDLRDLRAGRSVRREHHPHQPGPVRRDQRLLAQRRQDPVHLRLRRQGHASRPTQEVHRPRRVAPATSRAA